MKHKTGTLIQDKFYPQDGIAIVLGFSKSLGYKLFVMQTGKLYWFCQEYVEEDCERLPFQK